MADPKVPPQGASPDAEPPAPEPSKSEDRRSGRVAFDARGNAVWEWSMSTGVFARNVDTRRLKKLQENDLKIAEEPTPKTGKGVQAPPPRPPGGGFDPYNSGAAGGRAGVSPQKGKPRDLKRLSEWIEKQRAQGKKPTEGK